MFAVVVAIFGPVQIGGPPEAQAASPNVLIIVTDDQRWEGTMVSDVMPKTLQWFGDGGVHFENGIANTPLCCPARASIFSGRYAHNHRVDGQDGTLFGTFPDDGEQATSLQKYLNVAGYRTAIFGKYLNGWGINCADGAPPDKPPHFDEFAVFNVEYSPTCVMSGVGDPPPPAPPGPAPIERNVSTYSTTYVKNKALDFLDDAAGSPDPWFLYLAPVAPHGPFQPEPKHENTAVPPLEAPGPSSPVFEADRSDKPDWVYSDDDRDLAWHKENWTAHLRMLRSVDEMVDEVMEEIRSKGEEGETLAFFTSDNGFEWGDHGLQGKARPYVNSSRVPFYMRWKDHVTPATRPFAAHVDIAPTVFDAMDPEPETAPKDGVSLLAAGERKRILHEMSGGNTLGYTVSPPLRWSGILTSEFHYIERYGTFPDGHPEAGKTDYDTIIDREYYDLDADPEELTNLLKDGDPLNNPPTAELSAALRQDVECEGSEPIPGETECPGPGDEVPLEARIVRAPTEVEYSEPFQFSEDSLSEDSDDSGSQISRFNFTSSEPGMRLKCRVAGPVPQAEHECAASMQYATYLPGEYTLYVKAEDPNTPGRPASAEKQYTWTVNQNGLLNGPETYIGAHPPKRSNQAQAWFTFSASTAGAVFRCQLNDRPPEYCSSPYQTPADLGDAPASSPHVFRVWANTGNDDPTPAQYTWSIDTTPLQIRVASFRAPPSNPHTRDATFRFQATGPCAPAGVGSCDANGQLPHTEFIDEIDHFECKLDGADWQPCTGAAGPASRPTRYSDLPDGTHTFQARVIDRAGNPSAAYPNPAHQWTVGDVQAYGSTSDSTWPEVTDAAGSVRAVVSDGCYGWYVGGSFNQLGGVSVTNLAHIKVDPLTFAKTVDTAWLPNVDGAIRAMLLSDDMRTLYIGGLFTSVNSQSRPRLAALKTPIYDPPDTEEATTPCLAQDTTNMLMSWNPAPSNAVYALAPGSARDGDNAYIYAGGAFTTFAPGGSTVIRRKVAKLSTVDTGAVDTTWDPQFPVSTTVVLALAVKPGSVYIGTDGAFSLRGPDGGTVSRSYLGEIDSKSAEATPWNPAPSHNLGTAPSVQSLAYDPKTDPDTDRLPTVFVGGAFTHIGAPPVPRSGVAEINVADGGSATSWSPTTANTGTNLAVALPPPTRVMNAPTLRAPAHHNSVLYGGSGPVKLAETDPSFGLTTGWSPNPNGHVHDIGVSLLPPEATGGKEVLAVGGLFTTPRQLLAFYCRPPFTSCPSNASWPP